MLWSSISAEKMEHNLLVTGTCACPGIIFGRICIWNNEFENNFEEGDILLFDNASDEFPLWAIEKSSAVISCNHTSYSHLTSFTMALNKPCIVGATFSRIPENHSTVIIDTWEKIVAYSDNSPVLMSKKQSIWLTDIANNVCRKLYSNKNKPLAHIISFEGRDCYINHVSGIFLDSFLFQKDTHSVINIKNIIVEIHHSHPNVEIYYRFSPNSIGNMEYNSELQSEVEFVSLLQKEGIPVSVFVANAVSYADIIAFRKFISHTYYPNLPVKIGTMIENIDIVNDLDSMVADKLIDFAAVGINDLMSSCLQLERDDPKNQEKFRINTKPVLHVLTAINKSLSTQGIPFFIGYPKYPYFLSDYELLTDLGYTNFFGTHSLFAIAAKYNSYKKE